MSIDELTRRIEAAGESSHYSVRARPQPDVLPDDVIVLEPSVDKPGKWVVYYTERGQTWIEGTFDDEASACDYVQSLLPT